MAKEDISQAPDGGVENATISIVSRNGIHGTSVADEKTNGLAHVMEVNGDSIEIVFAHLNTLRVRLFVVTCDAKKVFPRDRIQVHDDSFTILGSPEGNTVLDIS